MSPSNYFEYFRSLAIRHKDIAHKLASENGTGKSGDRRFGTISYDEFLNGLNYQIAFPALMVEMFEVVLNGPAEVPNEKYSGAFTILKSAKVDSASEKAAAFDITFRIMSEILKQMYQDHFNIDESICQDPPLGDLELNMNPVPVGPVINSEYGWRTEFYFSKKDGINISSPPAPGIFVNP